MPNKQQKRGESKKSLEKYRKLAEEYLAGWKRVQADFENFKKEEIKRIEESEKYVQRNLILEIIPILDNLNLALKHASSSDGRFAEGIGNIRHQLEETLARHGISEIVVKRGDGFNPELHEAVRTVKGKEKDTVVRVLQKGYVFNDKLLRPAKVEVGE